MNITGVSFELMKPSLYAPSAGDLNAASQLSLHLNQYSPATPNFSSLIPRFDSHNVVAVPEQKNFGACYIDFLAFSCTHFDLSPNCPYSI